MENKESSKTATDQSMSKNVVKRTENGAKLGHPKRFPRRADSLSKTASPKDDNGVKGGKVIGAMASRGNEIGVPSRKPLKVSEEWTQKQHESFQPDRPEAAASDIQDSLDFGVDATGRAIRSVFINTTTLLAISALLSLFLLFVFSQTLIAIGALRNITDGVPITGTIVEALIYLLLMLILAFFARVLWLFWNLKRSHRYEIPTARALRERADLRRKASRARSNIVEYINDYMKLDWKPLQFTENEAKRLHETSKILLERELVPDEEWFAHFERGFVAALDDCAQRRIRRARNFVAVKTAAMPIGMIDTMIVAIHSLWLIGDIARIYNLRSGSLGVVMIAGHALVNSYIASGLGDASEALLRGGEETEPGAQAADVVAEHAVMPEATGDVGQTATDQATEASSALLDKLGINNGTLEEFGLSLEDVADISASTAGAATRFFSPKIAEGLANGFLVTRLGKTAVTLVRPIR